MKRLRRLWWSIRQRVVPLRGMRATYHGVPLMLFLDDLTCRWLYETGFASLDEIEYLAKAVVRPGDIVVDVGAHYGYVTTIFAKYVGESGKVVAVEAAPHTVARLRKQVSCSGFSNIEVVSAAVGESAGYASMNVSFEGRQDCQFIETSPVKSNERFFTERIIVEVRTLDNVMESVNMSAPALVKIDVEGFEQQVLRGAAGLLNSPDPPWLFVEIQKASHSRAGSNLGVFVESIFEFSSSVFRIDRSGIFRPATKESILASTAEESYFNIAVVPPRGLFADRLLC